MVLVFGVCVGISLPYSLLSSKKNIELNKVVRVFFILISDREFDLHIEYETDLKFVANIHSLIDLQNAMDYLLSTFR